MPKDMGINVSGQPTGTPNGMNKQLPSFSGTTTTISTTIADLNAAMAAAAPGDVFINNIPDANAVGQIILPKRADSSGWCWLRPPDSKLNNLPAYNPDYLDADHTDRIKASHQPNLARAYGTSAGGNNSPLTTATQAEGWWVTGHDVAPNPTNGNVQNFGLLVSPPTNVTDWAFYPRRITFERGFIHGDLADPNGGNRLPGGAKIQGEEILLAHNRISNIRSTLAGGDQHALGGIHGPRYALAFNNFLDGCGMCTFFGGGDPHAINTPANFLSSDIALIRNEEYPNPAYPTNAQRKNLFELKGGRRIFRWGIVGHGYIPFGQFRAWTMSCINQVGDFTWIEIHDVIEIGCLYTENDGGTVNIHPRGVSSGCGGNCPTLGVRKIQIMQTAWINPITPSPSGIPARLEVSSVAGAPYDPIDDVQLDHLQTSCGQWLLSIGDQATSMPRFKYKNSVNDRSLVVGPLRNASSTNSAMLNAFAGVGNWEYRKNVSVSGGAAFDATLLGSPHNNVQTLKSNIFVDVNDVTKGVKAPYDTYADDGTPVGPWWPFLLAATAGVRQP